MSSEIKVLQASIDAVQSNLTTIYAAITANDLVNPDDRKALKIRISEEWSKKYAETKAKAAGA